MTMAPILIAENYSSLIYFLELLRTILLIIILEILLVFINISGCGIKYQTTSLAFSSGIVNFKVLFSSLS